VRLIHLVIFSILLLSLVASAGNQMVNRLEIETNIRYIAEAEGFDPDLAVAIAKVESNLNVRAIGQAGEVGVFQLHPTYHRISKHYRQNAITAIRYLKAIEPKCRSKYGDAWFICFNLGPHYPRHIKRPKQFSYYLKVKREINKLALNER